MYGDAPEPSDRSWNFNGSAENESTFKPLCQQVEKNFLLPARRLCRYFATADDAYLRTRYGTYFRGFHVPVLGSGDLPEDLRRCFFHPPEDIPESATFDEQIAFDNLIYIRHSTCADATSLVTTYAHESQHFVQHGNAPRLLAVNEALRKKLKTFEPTAIASDIPSEKEANIKSKQVAELVCGSEAVRVFAEEQTRLMEQAGEQDERARWVFFRDVPSSTKYDLLEETLLLVERWLLGSPK